MLTTGWVLAELGNALVRPGNRKVFVSFVEDPRTDSRVTVVPPDQQSFDVGFALFRKRPDKQWSLTDCISFAVMREHGLTDALTADRHFAQAGFNALLLTDATDD